MSIANIICQGRSGYLISDSGYFERDGRVSFLAPKVLELPRLRAAIVARGHFRAIENIGPGVKAARCRDVFDMLNLLPTLLYGLLDHVGAIGAPLRAAEFATHLSVVWYCPTRHRAAASIIASDRNGLPDDYEPFTHLCVTEALQPGVEVVDAIGREADLTDPAAFDVNAEVGLIAEAQRRSTWSFNGIPAGHHAAGAVRLTRVNSGGVSTRTIREWQDTPGCRVTLGGSE